MSVKPRGVLTASLHEAILTIIGTDDKLKWAKLSRLDIQEDLEPSKQKALAILREVNTQLVNSEQAWCMPRPGHYQLQDCPDKNLLISMFSDNHPRITSIAELKLETVISEYGDMNLQSRIDVCNWCRRFMLNKSGVFTGIEANVTVGGGIYQDDKYESTTASAGYSNPDLEKAMANLRRAIVEMPAPTPSGSGDMVGRMSVGNGVIKTIRGLPYDPKNLDHRKLAAQKGYDPDTGKKK